MGSYLQTCGISGLPIEYEDPVVGVIITTTYAYQSDDQLSGYVGSGGTWQVISLPFYGKYDDYGLIDIEDSTIADEFFQQYNLRMTVKQLIEAKHEDDFDINLDLGQPYGRNPMRLMLMHRELFDKFSEKGEVRWTKTTLQQQLDLIPEFMEKWSEAGDESIVRMNSKGSGSPLDRKLRYEFGRPEFIKLDSKIPSLMQSFFAFPTEGVHSRLKSQFSHAITNNYDQLGFDGLKPVFELMLRLLFVDGAMNSLRRMWHPQTGMGAGDTHWDMHLDLNKWALQHIKDAKRRYDE